LGVQFTRQNRHAEAAQAYRAALALDSTNADGWNNFGWSLAKLGFYDESLPAFRTAVRLKPPYTLAANNLAWAAGEVPAQRFKQAFALQQTGRDAEAVPIYRELIADAPQWVNAHYNLGHALMKLGHDHEAAAEFQRTVELKPDFTEARAFLADCNAALKRGVAGTPVRPPDDTGPSPAKLPDQPPGR
jgi:Tfp pilus assembly protein PilF